MKRWFAMFALVLLPSAVFVAAEDEEVSAAIAAPASERLAPRPALSAEDYRAEVATLRALYARPPSEWPAPNIDDEVRPHFRELGQPPPVPDDPVHSNKVELGRQLFFDPRLSGSGQIACASCHDPDLGWADGRTLSFGHGRKVLKRNTPTVQNAARLPTLFWDGRAVTLEQQAEAVLLNEDEMHSSEATVQERVSGLPAYRRISRAIADMSLARAEGTKDRFYSMSAQIESEKKQYYLNLEQSQKGGVDITSWLEWFLSCLGRSIAGAEEGLADVLRKAKIRERINSQAPINERQRKVINRLLDGFEGKLSTSKYARLADCSADTALRDIGALPIFYSSAVC